MGFWNRFKSLDLYRDVPRDLTEQTTSVSVLATLFISYLFISEFLDFNRVKTVSDMLVDAPRDTEESHAMLQINMNITMHRVPCAVLSVDAQDVMGSHVMDVGGQLHKTRLSAEGELKVGAGGEPLAPEGGEVRDQIGEGCRVNGNMIVKRVPGNFHISVHGHVDLVHIFFPAGDMNISHTIHHLSFGDKILVDAARGSNPLNGVSKWAVNDDEDEYASPKSYEYYIKIVPTTFRDLRGDEEHSFQFVANSNQVAGYRIPAAYFRYDLSPITMVFAQEKTPLSHFLVQICAIVGGVFTVLGMVNSIVNKSLARVLAKAEMNKLG